MKRLIVELSDNKTEWVDLLDYIVNQVKEGYLAGEKWDISEWEEKKLKK